MSDLRSLQSFNQLTPAVRQLIFLTGGGFLLQFLIPGRWVDHLALVPDWVIHRWWLWQLLSYPFFHVNFLHLFFNLFALWMFGPQLEASWGTRRFVLFYFSCAWTAALVQTAVAPLSLVLGASAPIFGLLTAFALMFSDVTIYVFFVLPFRATQAALFIGLLSLVSSLGSSSERWGYLCQLAGIATGFLWIKIPLRLEPHRWQKMEREFRHPKGQRTKNASGSAHNLAEDVDRILEKISAKGVQSLTPEEHELMKRYAQKKG